MSHAKQDPWISCQSHHVTQGMTRGGTYFFGGSSLLFHYFLHFLLIFILLGVFVFGVDFLVRVTGCTEGKERKNNRLSHLLAYSLVTLYHSHSHTPALITHLTSSRKVLILPRRLLPLLVSPLGLLLVRLQLRLPGRELWVNHQEVCLGLYGNMRAIRTHFGRHFHSNEYSIFFSYPRI